MKKHLIVILFIIILSPSVTWAASHFIRSGASGSTCADWGANACNALPATLTRGDTYYVGKGSYAGRIFNTSASGTSVITIKGATEAEHGTDTGWSSSYSVDINDGGGQATWTSGVTFSTSYWVFDGSVGPTWDKTVSHYGFLFSPTSYPITIANTSAAMSNITIGHVTATAPSGDTEKFFIRTDNSTKNVTNVDIHHCLTSGWQNFWWATSPGLTMDNWTCEYNTILQQWGSAANHGESINNNYSNMTGLVVRYTWFEGYAATGVTGVIVANNNNVNSPAIYGNVFKGVYGSNGVITGTSAGNFISPHIYNNTFIQADNGGAWIGGNVTGTPVIQNNLLYSMSANSGAPGSDYNAYFSTTNPPSESHGQTGSGNPFVNLSAGDLHLTAATSAGISLASPYNMDVSGNTRGADGIWDRGAFEFGGNLAAIRPNPPILH